MKVRRVVNLELWECKDCGKPHPEVSPYTHDKSGTVYFRPFCKKCDNNRRKKYKYQPASEASKEKASLKGKAIRANKSPEVRASLIIKNSTGADKARNRATQLDLESVVRLITLPCRYCGCTELTTLGRIDNSVGHILSNVVPACMRCNITRGGMPYEAWLVVSKGMKEAREAGLFGEWTGRTSKSPQ